MDARSRKANALFLIAFQYVKGFGAARQATCLQHFDSPQAFLAAASKNNDPLGLGEDVRLQLRELAARKPGGNAYQRALADQERCSAQGWALLTCFDENYPQCLSEISRPPPLLYLQGDNSLLQGQALAMVGSRKASAGARQSARLLAGKMAQSGLVIVSGLASGIDSEAHKGALECGGSTIAVIGTGLDKCYPPQNRKLAADIAEHGLIVSEFRLNSAPLPGNFPRRNRIISGLSQGVLVVEATARSGSLITARLALEQNREVFALPGAFGDLGASGNNQLIQQGAKLVLGPEDILEELPGITSTPAGNTEAAAGVELTPQTRLLLDAIAFSNCSADDICERSGLPVHEVVAGLAELELLGLVALSAGGYQRLQ
jgi:DNA processing protein